MLLYTNIINTLKDTANFKKRKEKSNLQCGILISFLQMSYISKYTDKIQEYAKNCYQLWSFPGGEMLHLFLMNIFYSIFVVKEKSYSNTERKHEYASKQKTNGA